MALASLVALFALAGASVPEYLMDFVAVEQATFQDLSSVKSLILLALAGPGLAVLALEVVAPARARCSYWRGL